MGGAPEGLTGTGTVEIKVLDINDNIPTLEKSDVRNTTYSTHTYTHCGHSPANRTEFVAQEMRQ